MGGYDSSLIVPNNVSIAQKGDPPGDTVANVRSIKTNATTEPLLPGGPIYSFVDSTLPYIYLPLDACRAFEKAFGLVWNPVWNLYLLNDTTHQALLRMNPTLVFTVAAAESDGDTVDISLPYAAFDLNISYPFINATSAPYLNTSKYFPLKRAEQRLQYTLGRTFLQEAYLITDFEHHNFSLSQRNWTPNGPSRIETIYPAGYEPPRIATDSELSKGKIAGIVIGAVIGAVLMGVFLWVGVGCYRRRKQRKDAQLVAQHGEKQRQSYQHANAPIPASYHASELAVEKVSQTRHELHAEDGKGPVWEADSAARAELSDNNNTSL